MKAKKIHSLVVNEVARQLDLAQTNPSLSTLTVHFDNKAVSIPYQPWRPRTDVTLPGRWVDGEEPDA